ncbi:hypothetical protein LCGC14_1486300, partial [marine sediment metagenome]
MTVLMIFLYSMMYISAATRLEVYDYDGTGLRQKINYSLFDAENYTGVRANFTGNISASTGFFSYLGSLLNRITILFVQDINVTGNSFLNLNWTYLQNYPVACPAGTFLTQLNDSVTCTAPVADDIDPGDFPVGNYSFDSNT